MKKIIWIFGESATGKLTLINNLYNKDNNTLNILNMNNKKISISEITLEDRKIDYKQIDDDNNYDDSLMEENNLFFNKENAKQRRSFIMHDVTDFINSDNDILLIKGQVNDMNIKRGNIIGYFLDKYYGLEGLEIEVYILQVNDEALLRKRIESKPWFQKMSDDKEKERLLEIIPSKQEKHINDVINAFGDKNVPIYQIESLEGSYRMGGVINGKSSSIRR